jgi:hypothetical protein
MVNAGPTAVDEAPRFALELDSNVPNPFSGTTSLRFRLPVEGEVRMELFDVTGKRVASRNLGSLAAGEHIVSLESRTEGRPLPSGVYFCRVTASGETATRKVTIAR